MTITPQPVRPPRETAKRLLAHAQWQGEYVYLFGEEDYWFRKCVVCGRSFEGAAGRVAQAKKRGVCPACEETTTQEQIKEMTEQALRRDRARYRACHPPAS